VSKSTAAGKMIRCEFRLRQVHSGMAGPVLFTTTANQGQIHVDLELDNNTGYMYAFIE
jgi:hypothetical protein